MCWNRLNVTRAITPQNTLLSNIHENEVLKRNDTLKASQESYLNHEGASSPPMSKCTVTTGRDVHQCVTFMNESKVSFESCSVRGTSSKSFLFLLHFFSRKDDKNSRGLSWKMIPPQRKSYLKHSTEIQVIKSPAGKTHIFSRVSQLLCPEAKSD
jgi:hypothetical protein